jgi:hypothetical protein
VEKIGTGGGMTTRRVDVGELAQNCGEEGCLAERLDHVGRDCTLTGDSETRDGEVDGRWAMGSKAGGSGREAARERERERQRCSNASDTATESAHKQREATERRQRHEVKVPRKLVSSRRAQRGKMDAPLRPTNPTSTLCIAPSHTPSLRGAYTKPQSCLIESNLRY